MSTAIVILSKDRPDLLKTLYDSTRLYLPDYHVILVDNGTDDLTPKYAKKFDWERLSYGRNTSFSEGVNLAIQDTHYSRYILLNNDAIPDADLLDEHVDASAPLLGSLIIDSLAKVNHAGVAFGRNGMPVHVGRGDKLIAWYDQPNKVWPAVTFACASVDADTFLTLGGLDEQYVYGYEDTDFCARFVERLQMLPEVTYRATAVHDEFGTRKPGSDVENAQRFYAIWMAGNRYRKALEKAIS